MRRAGLLLDSQTIAIMYWLGEVYVSGKLG